MFNLSKLFISDQSLTPDDAEEIAEMLAEAQHILSAAEQSEEAFLGSQFILIQLGVI